MIEIIKNIARAILGEEISNLQKELDRFEQLISEKDALIKELADKVSDLSGNNELANKLNNKYPKANIEYMGRTFGTSKDKIPIDVRLLITPQDYHIIELIEKNKLQIKDPEKDVPRLYKWIENNYYKYVYDKDNYGITEYWEFPFEILEKKALNSNAGFDCDSWANFQASFYIAAGMPAYKVRVVVGGCKLGGHSTVYVYSEKTGKWHHLNSTYGKIKDTISEYPTTDDALTTDALGIIDVWMSFNHLYSWHVFKTDAAEDSYNKLNKNLIIKPLKGGQHGL